MGPMRLRLYHHRDGARVAYREVGAGPPLALLHSGLLSHKEWEPVVEGLADRFRVVLPDLPLHGDSEQRPRHPYTLDWFAEVMAGFSAEVLGPRPLLGGHDAGAEILLRAVELGWIAPSRLVLMPNRLHVPPARGGMRAAVADRRAGRDRAGPGRAALLRRPAVFRPQRGVRLCARGNPAAADLVRHAFADVPRQLEPRALVGAVPRTAGRAARSASCSTSTRGWTCRCCCCGPTAIACTRSRRPKRRSSCCPTGSCACWPARAS